MIAAYLNVSLRRDAGVPYKIVNAYVILAVIAELRNSSHHKPQYGRMTWHF
jgi:hypothetical protein